LPAVAVPAANKLAHPIVIAATRRNFATDDFMTRMLEPFLDD
jgi:hypothetical protein